MAVISGALLVLATWTALVAFVLLIGLGPALVFGCSRPWTAVVRAALWLGLGLATLFVLAIGVFVPLRSPAAGLAFGALALVSAIGGLVLAHRSRPFPFTNQRLSGVRMVSLATFIAVICFQTVRALGPVTNYDTGMYHLGAIKYAAEYATIPGLANLFFPFGYTNSWFPVAAFLGNGPWDGIGYRLANGLLIVLVLTELGLRLLDRRLRWGTVTLLLSVTACFLPLIGIADFWVVSPTSDTAIMLLTLIAVAYLVDVITADALSGSNAAIVVVLVGLMVSMRPTAIAFGATAIAVLLFIAWRRRAQGGLALPRVGVLLLGAWVLLLAGVQVVRDVMLSGWLLYPLSVLAFDVPWLAADPTGPRDATLAAARDPYAPDHWQVAHSWSWIPAWLSQRVALWETYLFLLACLLAVVALIVCRRRGASLPWKRIAAAAVPSGVAIVAWFLASPPSYRFIFGPLFTLPIIVLAAALVGLIDRASEASRRRWLGDAVLLSTTAVLILVTGYSATFRNQVSQISEPRQWAIGPIAVDYAIAPLPLPATEPVVTSRGLEVQVPADGGDQCWDAWPLCTWNPSPLLGLRGSSLQEGFVGEAFGQTRAPAHDRVAP